MHVSSLISLHLGGSRPCTLVHLEASSQSGVQGFSLANYSHGCLGILLSSDNAWTEASSRDQRCHLQALTHPQPPEEASDEQVLTCLPYGSETHDEISAHSPECLPHTQECLLIAKPFYAGHKDGSVGSTLALHAVHPVLSWHPVWSPQALPSFWVYYQRFHNQDELI